MTAILWCLLAQDLQPGRAVEGRIGEEGAVTYRFAAEPGGRYRVTVRLGTLADSVLTLTAPDGTVVTRNDDARGELGCGSRIDWICERAGMYDLLVGPYTDEEGTFTILLEVVAPPPPPPDDPTPPPDDPTPPPAQGELVPGRESAGTVPGAQQSVDYRVNVQGGRRYRVTVVPGTLRDSRVAVLDAQGRTIAENDDAGGELDLGSRVEWATASDGAVTIRVMGYGSYSGDYRVLWEAIGGGQPPTAAPGSGRLEAGDATLANGRLADTYAHEGRAGDRITITMRSPEFDTFLILRGPGGFSQENDDAGGDLGRDSRIIVTLSESGRYEIVATSYPAGATGAYTLDVDSTPAAPAAALARGGTTQGRLENTDERLEDGRFADTYSYAGRRGEQVTITLRSEEYDVVLGINGPGGLAQVNDDAGGDLGRNSRLTVTLPQDGTYQVVATSYSANVTGSYTLTIDR